MDEIALLGCEQDVLTEQFKRIVQELSFLQVTPNDYAALRFYSLLQSTFLLLIPFKIYFSPGKCE